MWAGTDSLADWLRLIGYPLAAVVGGLITWLMKGFGAKDLLAWWNRPKLAIELSEPIYTEARAVAPRLAGGPAVAPEDCRFYHLDVMNLGRTAAKECEAEIVAVEEELHGERNPLASSTNLCFLHWARTPLDQTRIDIPPRISRMRPSRRLLDFCTQRIPKPCCLHVFRAAPKVDPDGLQTAYGPGTYCFTVCVRVGEHHVQPATIVIRVEIDPSGQPFRIETVS